MRLLTPTENKRLNELVGFLCVTVAMLTALALISYSPHDAAWNVSANGPDSATTNNWIGPAGAYRADLLFQVFGFAAFLLPMALAVLGWRWLKNRPINSQIATLMGYALLLLALPSLLTLVAFSGCARHGAARRDAGFVRFRRIAHRVQSHWRESGGFCAVTYRFVHDHEIFFFRRPRLGQWAKRPYRRS